MTTDNETVPVTPSRNIRQRLNAVMQEVAYVQKTKQIGDGKYAYKAITHDEVVAVTRPSFVKHGVMVEQSLLQHQTVDTGRMTAGGTKIIRFEGYYEMSFVNIDQPDDRVTVKVAAHADDQGDKAPGKCASYAKKGAIVQVLLLETGTEAEEERTTGEKEKPNGAGMEKHTARQVTVDALEAMEPDEQKFLHNEATVIIALHEDQKPMLPYIDGANYDTEEQLALWSLLPSRVRSAIKHEKQVAALQGPKVVAIQA